MTGPVVYELTRRRFVAGAGALGLTALTGVATWLRPAAAQVPAVGIAPDDPAVRATMTALADTIVPGRAGGADTGPGAVEAGAVEELYDPFYGLVTAIPFMHHDLQLAAARLAGGRRFDLLLPYADRERVVTDRITSIGDGGRNPAFLLYQGAAIIVYVAYYGTARSEEGPRWIGFPPASDGYWPRHSYRLRFRGMTRNGNPP